MTFFSLNFCRFSIFFFADSLLFCLRPRTTDTQREIFQKSQIFGFGQTNWAENYRGIWSIFGQFISTHFGTLSPMFMFSINQLLSLKKTEPLYPNLKYLFRIGI